MGGNNGGADPGSRVQGRVGGGTQGGGGAFCVGKFYWDWNGQIVFVVEIGGDVPWHLTPPFQRDHPWIPDPGFTLNRATSGLPLLRLTLDSP